MNASTENYLLELETPEVRDLAWSCFSAPLLLGPLMASDDTLYNASFVLTNERGDWLRALDQDPRPLRAHLALGHSTRLGLYFERLWHFFLAQDPEVELLAHNLPVRDSTHTIGEFDCIYYCHQRQRNVHLELAVKFYLSAPGAIDPALSNWLGPNSHDRLDLKLQRMLSHQVRLADTPAGASVLAELGVTDPLREIEIKGRLFANCPSPAPAPCGYNHALPLSQWCFISDLPGMSDTSVGGYLALERQQWLAPIQNSKKEALSVSDLTAMVIKQWQNDSRPLQVAVIDDHGYEQRRFFLVQDHWPASYE